MIAKGGKAPNFNLCNVSVTGSNLFCAESKGIPRIQMPQLDDKQTRISRSTRPRTYARNGRIN